MGGGGVAAGVQPCVGVTTSTVPHHPSLRLSCLSPLHTLYHVMPATVCRSMHHHMPTHSYALQPPPPPAGRTAGPEIQKLHAVLIGIWSLNQATQPALIEKLK